MQKQTRNIALVVILLLISLPYLLAALAGGSQSVFAGFLLNPWDGATYLAKLRMGSEGAWSFTLPFTAETGNGSYLYLFYLGLGHAARLLGAPLAVVYHLARLVGAALLVLALERFLRQMFPDRADLQRAGLWLMCLGAGMGWLVIFFGPTPSDFWVAEAYPFLSMYTNPHFPLGLALLLACFSTLIDGRDNEPGRGQAARLTWLALAGLLIAVILPFGVVVLLVVAGAWLAWETVKSTAPLAARLWRAAAELVSLGCLSGPYMLYQYWAMVTDPLLSGWNAQNITPTPPVWDLLLSFSPAFVLALVGIWALRKGEQNAARRMAMVWFVLGLALAAVPFALQRRFLLGYYIPATALAILGMDILVRRWPAQKKRLWGLFFGLALPSTMLVILIGQVGVLTQSPMFYMAEDEARALEWIDKNTPRDALVMAAPEMGRWIPGFSGRRVIYGHPYETVNAEEEEAWVIAAYSASDGAYVEKLQARGVDYLFYGPRERKINPALDRTALRLVFDSALVQVYAVGSAP